MRLLSRMGEYGQFGERQAADLALQRRGQGGPAGLLVPLRLPTIDHAVIPSYVLARYAHWVFLGGFAVLGAGALAASLLVKMNLTIAASGAIEPAAVWPVRSLEAGVIVDIMARTGATVTRGTSVALLDRFASDGRVRDLELQIREHRAALERTSRALPLTLDEQRERLGVLETAVFRAKAALRERVVDMSGSGNVDSVLATYVPGSRTRIDLAYADLRTAEAELRAGRAVGARFRTDSMDLRRQRYELERLEDELVRMREQVGRLAIVAPADGVVLTDQLERRIGAFVQPGEQVLEIADLDRWQVALFVSERDVHDVKLGQRVTLEIPALEALDGRQLQGLVVAVAPQPASLSSTVEADAALPSPGSFRVAVALQPGELAQLGTDALRRGYVVRGRVVTRSGRISQLVISALRDWLNEHRWW